MKRCRVVAGIDQIPCGGTVPIAGVLDVCDQHLARLAASAHGAASRTEYELYVHEQTQRLVAA